jgi:hypothetical protein
VNCIELGLVLRSNRGPSKRRAASDIWLQPPTRPFERRTTLAFIHTDFNELKIVGPGYVHARQRMEELDMAMHDHVKRSYESC